MNSISASNGPMKIGIYLPGMSGPGSGVWTRLLGIVEILRLRNDVDLFVAVDNNKYVDILDIDSDHCLVFPELRGFRRYFTTSRRVGTFVEKFGLDVVQIEALPVPTNHKVPVLLSLHDLRQRYSSFWPHPTFAKLYAKLLLSRAIARTAGVLALSIWGATEISKELVVDKEKVHVISPIAPTAAEIPFDFIPPERLQSGEFIVAVGHLEPRKNLEILVEATKSQYWPAGVTLVIAGKDQGSLSNLQSLSSDAPVAVEMLGPVDEATKWWLLKNASVIAVPSLIEGFGIVSLEAFEANTPVLVADASALPEVVCDSRAVVSPMDSIAWARQIYELHTDAELRGEFKLRQERLLSHYQAQTIGTQLIDVYRKVLSERI